MGFKGVNCKDCLSMVGLGETDIVIQRRFMVRFVWGIGSVNSFICAFHQCTISYFYVWSCFLAVIVSTLRDTVGFWSIHQSQIMQGTWHAKIWLLSWVTDRYWCATLIYIWQFLPKFQPTTHNDLIFTLPVYCHHKFHSKHGWNSLTSSHVWWNFSIVTVLQVR